MMKHYEVYVGRCEEKKVHLIDNFTIHTGEAGDLALLNKCVEKFCRRSGYQYMSGSFKLGVGFIQKVGFFTKGDKSEQFVVEVRLHN